MLDVKVGDKVVLESYGIGSIKYLVKTVDRVTKTQIIIGNMKYKKDTGRQIGNKNKWYPDDKIHLPSVDMIEKVNDYQNQLRKYHLVKDLSEFDWNKFDLERLNEIAAFVGLNK
jgi:hypothetical protein